VPKIASNGIRLWHETFGRPGDPPVLLIMGQGAQATGWPEPFCRDLAAAGRLVIRYDNRDVGYSSWFGDDEPYSLDDMAADTVGLPDGLRLERAHLVGASLGGAIAQIVAIRWPQRVLTLTSIMASAGRDEAADAARDTALLDRFERERQTDDAEAIAESVESWRLCAGRSRPFDEAWWTGFVTEQHRRRPHPAANAHHREAARRSGSRLAELARITAPTLVIHGDEDPLVPFAEGEAVARAIPGARVITIRGMGHELPPWALAEMLPAIVAHTAVTS
jgi:pimeloyl-ACP methyl ester carboxylesterase